MKELTFETLDERGKPISKEEVYSYWYLRELQEHGWIEDAIYQPKSYTLIQQSWCTWQQQLKTKTKLNRKQLFPGHSYTPDWEIIWREKAIGIMVLPITDVLPTVNGLETFAYDRHYNNPFNKIPFICNLKGPMIYSSLVDVKGDAARAFIKSTVIFPINQKLMLDKHGLYVQAMKIPSIFKNTFTPQRYLSTDKQRKPRLLKYEPVMIGEYADAINNQKDDLQSDNTVRDSQGRTISNSRRERR